MALRLFKNLREQIDSIIARDPAARSRLEIILCYPGFHALLFYRLASTLWRHGFLIAGRFVSHCGRLATGIEIHPGATIGRRVFIDHGMGVVIGEMAEVGDDVTLYQGVTLGGTSLERGKKRHPTLESGVIVGSGAQLLGPITVGRNARVGANAVVVADVSPSATVVGIPAKRVGAGRAVPPLPRSESPAPFLPYGTPCGELPDPVARAIQGLVDEVVTLRARIEHLERGGEEHALLVDGTSLLEGRGSGTAMLGEVRHNVLAPTNGRPGAGTN